VRGSKREDYRLPFLYQSVKYGGALRPEHRARPGRRRNDLYDEDGRHVRTVVIGLGNLHL